MKKIENTFPGKNAAPRKIDRTALVTGGNRGLGFEVSRQLGKLGYIVVLTSRNAAEGKKAAADLESENLRVVYHELDVTSARSIHRLFRFISEKYKRLDVLVNNAGVLLDPRSHGGAARSSIFDTSLSILKATVNTNVYGPFQMCQTFIPLMNTHSYGRVVNISSKLGQLSTPAHGTPCYRLSKTALNAVTRIFSDECHTSNVLVNSVCPGWVKTRMGGANAQLDPNEAVDTIIWLATLPDGGPTGGFFSEKKRIDW